MVQKPIPVNSEAAKELEKAQKQFDSFDQQLKEMSMDRMNAAPKPDVEPQTKLSSSELAKSPDVYLKPDKTIGVPEKFNEEYRSNYEYDKEYVCFIAENREFIGETIEIWTKPYAGVAAMFWKVPTNKPVWGPRYLAEQIKRKNYHRLSTQAGVIGSDPRIGTQYMGTMVVDSVIQRLDAMPATPARKSIFMGAVNF